MARAHLLDLTAARALLQVSLTHTKLLYTAPPLVRNLPVSPATSSFSARAGRDSRGCLPHHNCGGARVQRLEKRVKGQQPGLGQPRLQRRRSTIGFVDQMSRGGMGFFRIESWSSEGGCYVAALEDERLAA
eukprot:1605490-Rhodomonas_salina.2